MTVLTEGKRDFDFIVREASGYRSREVGTVVAPGGGDLTSGTVLGRLTANGNYVPVNLGGSDGSQTVAGVLLQRVEAGVTAKRTIIARECEVNEKMLVYPAGATAGNIITINNGLTAIQIIPR